MEENKIVSVSEFSKMANMPKTEIYKLISLPEYAVYISKIAGKKYIDINDPLSFRGGMERIFYSQIDDELNVLPENRYFPDPENPDKMITNPVYTNYVVPARQAPDAHARG